MQLPRQLLQLVFCIIILSLLAGCNTFSSHPPQLSSTPEPTLLPAPSLTPLPSPQPMFQTHYVLPDWFENRVDTVLMMVTEATSTATKLSFVNVDMGEIFDIWVPFPETYQYFWTWDGHSFGFITADYKKAYLVDTETGQATSYNLSQGTFECLKERGDTYSTRTPFAYTLGTISRNVEPNEDDFFCYDYDIDYMYSFEWESNIAYVTNKETKQSIEIQIDDPTQSQYPIAIAMRNATIVVLQDNQPKTPVEPESPGIFPPDSGNRIVSFDVSTGKIINTFDGEFGSFVMSPDGNKVFIWKKDEGGLDEPFVLDLNDGKEKHLENMYPFPPIGLGTIYWSDNSTQLYYLRSEGNSRYDICIYDLPTLSAFCPTQEITELTFPTSIERWEPLPSEKFFLFSYGCLRCDSGAWTAVVSRDGKTRYTLGKEIYLGQETSLTFPFDTVLVRPTQP